MRRSLWHEGSHNYIVGTYDQIDLAILANKAVEGIHNNTAAINTMDGFANPAHGYWIVFCMPLRADREQVWVITCGEIVGDRSTSAEFVAEICAGRMGRRIDDQITDGKVDLL